MDIPRTTPPSQKRYVYTGIGAGALALLAITVMSLKPAAPGVDRASVVIDSVRRGDMVIDVRGRGTLVPEQITWVSAVTAGRVDHINVRPPATVALLELTNPDVQLEARMTVEQDRLKVLSQSIGEQIALQQAQIAKLKAIAQFQEASVASMEEERGTLAVDDGRQLEESGDRVVSRGTDLRRVAATFSRAGRAPHAPSRAPLCLASALPPSPITSQRRRGSHVSVRRFDSGREPAVVKSIDGVGTRDIRSHVIVRPARQSVGINACCAPCGVAQRAMAAGRSANALSVTSSPE